MTSAEARFAELLLRRAEWPRRHAPSRIDAEHDVLTTALKDGGVVRLALDRPALRDPTIDSGRNQLSPLFQWYLLRPPAPNQQNDDERDYAETENRDERPDPGRSFARARAFPRRRYRRRDNRRARRHRLLLGLGLSDRCRLSRRDGSLDSGEGGGPVRPPGSDRGGAAAAPGERHTGQEAGNEKRAELREQKHATLRHDDQRSSPGALRDGIVRDG